MNGTLAEIRMFAGNFAPRGWMLCQGQLLSIAQWTAVFALVGTTYGGNGQTTFGVPDLRSRAALGTGQGPGLPNIILGEMAGQTSVTLLTNNLPIHTHVITGSVTPQANNDTAGKGSDPTGRRLASSNIFTSQNGDLVNMANDAISLTAGPSGGNQPTNTMSPYLGIEFILVNIPIYTQGHKR